MSEVLDASAVIAFVRGEPAADGVTAVLRAGTATVVSVNLAEVFDVLVRRVNVPAADVAVALRRFAGVVDVRAVDAGLALRAGALRAKHYHRDRAPLSLADCLCLAATAGADDRVLSSDAALLRVARAEGIASQALPDSRGHVARLG